VRPPSHGWRTDHDETRGAETVSFNIISKARLSESVFAMRLEAPEIAREALPGQFAILRIDEVGERFPLTLCDWSASEGWILVVFQVVGASTEKLSRLNPGDALADVVGPLGIPSEIERFGKVVCVGGGVGIAAVFPICRALKEAGNEVLSIVGARNSELLILEKEMSAVSDRLVVMTDDGSAGRKGLVTGALEEELRNNGADLVLAIGPAVMMKYASDATRAFETPMRVSLNSIMLDGTGMCGTCRVEVDGATKFACVEGPEFDGHADWDLLLNRLSQYKDEEALALSKAGVCGCSSGKTGR
jgi:ferredoxin--NADP+ reductase